MSPRLFLLDCSEPEERIRTAWPRLYAYLQHGRAQNIHTTYLTSRRTPWYSQEQRPPAPFLCTYMGRERSDGNPFRFFWNKSRATAANVYLLLYPRGELKAALAARPDLYPIVFAHLQSLTGEHLIKEGRVYGGGLHKMEPKELANLSADTLTRIIQVRPAAKQRHLAI